ncbi:hypothetical protein D3C87_1483330 [compost metagenome]
MVAEERRKRRLRVEVDGENPVAGHGEILGDMDRRGGLAGAALEVGDGNHLQVLAALAVTPFQVAARLGGIALGKRLLGKVAAERIDVGERIGAAAAGAGVRLRPLARERKLAQVAIGNTDQLGCLAGGEAAKRFHRGWRKQPLAHRLQLFGEGACIGGNRFVGRLPGVGKIRLGSRLCYRHIHSRRAPCVSSRMVHVGKH